jgi:hypothetical protein
MRKLDVLLLEQSHSLARKPTPRGLGVALHEQHDLALIHELPHPVVELFRRLFIRRSGGLWSFVRFREALWRLLGMGSDGGGKCRCVRTIDPAQ